MATYYGLINAKKIFTQNTNITKNIFGIGKKDIPEMHKKANIIVTHIEDENIPVGHRKMVEKEINGIGDGRLVAEYHRNGQIIGMRFTEVQD